jgi:hypothetical protein
MIRKERTANEQQVHLTDLYMYGTLYRARVPVPYHSTLWIFCGILEISYMNNTRIVWPQKQSQKSVFNF